MRRSLIFAAASIAALAWMQPSAAGKEQGYFTITLQEGRTAAGQYDRKQSFEIKDWSFEGVSKVDGFTFKQGVQHSSGEKGGTEDINIGVGELQEPNISKSSDAASRRGEAGVTLKGSNIKENAGRVRPSDVTMKRGTSPAPAIGQAIGNWANDGQDIPAPPPSGSLRVKVRMPWLACEEGKFYPKLIMGDPVKATYVLSDATVTGCSNEVVTFSYSKAEFERAKPH